MQAGLACEACALSQEFVHLRLSIKPVSRDQSARSFLLTESRCVVCGAGAAECRGGCGRGTAHQRSVRRRDIGSRAEAGLKGVIFLKLSPESVPGRVLVCMTTVYSYCSGRPYMCIRCICRGPPYIWMTTVIIHKKAPIVHVMCVCSFLRYCTLRFPSPRQDRVESKLAVPTFWDRAAQQQRYEACEPLRPSYRPSSRRWSATQGFSSSASSTGTRKWQRAYGSEPTTAPGRTLT